MPTRWRTYDFLPSQTTLLDVLASRKTLGVIGGDVLIGGKEKDIAFQKGTAYVEQGDVHVCLRPEPLQQGRRSDLTAP